MVSSLTTLRTPVAQMEEEHTRRSIGGEEGSPLIDARSPKDTRKASRQQYGQ